MTTRDEEMLAAVERAEDDDEDREVTYRRVRPPADPSQVYSVRIPVSRIEQLRKVAERKAMPPTALIRQWVVDQLDEELRPKQIFTVAYPAGSFEPQEDLKRRIDRVDRQIAAALGVQANISEGAQ